MAKKGEAWRYDETEKSRKKMMDTAGDRNCRRKNLMHKSADIYSDIVKTLQQEGFEGRDWKQWRTKTKHLKQGKFLDCECSPSGKIWFDHEQVDGRGMAPLRQFVF